MLRRSVAKAFGPSGAPRTESEAEPAAGEKGSRAARVNALFTELQGEIDRALSGAGGGEPLPAGAAGDPARAARRVTRAHPRPEGLEFLLEGANSLRILNSMDGVVWIHLKESSTPGPLLVATVHNDGQAFRAIVKRAGAGRTPFRFTTGPQLARELIEIADFGLRIAD